MVHRPEGTGFEAKDGPGNPPNQAGSGKRTRLVGENEILEAMERRLHERMDQMLADSREEHGQAFQAIADRFVKLETALGSNTDAIAAILRRPEAPERPAELPSDAHLERLLGRARELEDTLRLVQSRIELIQADIKRLKLATGTP